MRAAILVLTGCLAAAGAAAQTKGADAVLLRGATIHPVSGPEIAGGMILIRDGKIADIGAKVVAGSARVIDLKGLHVYPGLIDSATEIGLSEVSSVRETIDTTELGDFNPQIRAVIAVNPASEFITVTRANGTTTVISTPSGGILSGQAALLHLDGWTWQEMAVRPSAAMVLQFPIPQAMRGGYGGGFGGPPGRRPFAEIKKEYDKKLQQLHDIFEQARRYQQAKAAKAPGFEADLKREALQPVLEGKLPLVVHATRERAIRDALAFADKAKLKIVLAGAQRADKLAAEIKAKNVPVILGPTLSLPLEEDDPYDGPYSLPAALHKAGVKFAFGSFGNQFARNLPYQAANAVAYGLPYEEALRAVTLNAAEIWGVADQLGSIEKGKLADLIVTDGDPLETRTQLKRMFIRGKEVDLDTKHKRLYEKYMARP